MEAPEIVEQQPVQQPETQPEVPTTEQAPEQQASERDRGQEKPQVSRGLQKRFAKLTTRAKTAEAEAAYWRTQAITSGYGELSDDMPADQWQRVRNFQVANCVPAQVAENESESAPVREDSYRERAEKFRVEHPDFDQAIDRIVLREDVAEDVQEALLEHEKGPEVAYYLGQHPEIVERLNEMEPEAALREVERIANNAATPLTDGQKQHFEAHQRFVFDLGAKMLGDAEFAKTARALATAAHPDVVEYVGHVLADLENGQEVFAALAKRPDMLRAVQGMTPAQAGGFMQRLSEELAGTSESEAPKSQSRPIRPVRRPGPTATGLSDDLPIDEWRRRREAQIAKQRGA